MSKSSYDLLVVGAGPAGALAAATAAEAGLDVVLIEQKRFPRPKICGGFISARALSLLPTDFSLPEKESAAILQLSVSRHNKRFPFNADKPLGYLVQRACFDQLLSAYACKKGAVLLEKTTLKKIEPSCLAREQQNNHYLVHLRYGRIDKAIRVRFLIAADGALSHFAGAGGIDRRLRSIFSGWGLAEIITDQEDQSDLIKDPPQLEFFPLPSRGGMGWAFYGRGWLNRGVGGLCGRKALVKSYTRIFGAIPAIEKLRSWPLPFLGPFCKVAKGNLLLIGDAAGLVEPFSGEGLYNSLKSARLAVQAIKEAKAAGFEAAVPYSQLFETHFRSFFLSSLVGTVILHAQSLFYPEIVPRQIARLIENQLWFNDQNFDLQ